MYRTIDLKPEPAIAVVGQFAGPFQTAGRRANEFLSEFYEAVLGYNDHVAGINDMSVGVKTRVRGVGGYGVGYRD